MTNQKYLPLKIYEFKLEVNKCWISELDRLFRIEWSLIINRKPWKNFLNLSTLIKFERPPPEKELIQFFETSENVQNYFYGKKKNEYLFIVNCRCNLYDESYFYIPLFEMYPLFQKSIYRYLRVAVSDNIKAKYIKKSQNRTGCNPKIMKVYTYKDTTPCLLNRLCPLNEFFNFDFILNKEEKRDLYHALVEGYYDQPRKKSLLEIAKKYGIPRSTYQLHINQIESKIIKSFFKLNKSEFQEEL